MGNCQFWRGPPEMSQGELPAWGTDKPWQTIRIHPEMMVSWSAEHLESFLLGFRSVWLNHLLIPFQFPVAQWCSMCWAGFLLHLCVVGSQFFGLRGPWRRALGLFVPQLVDAITCNSAISACEEGKCWLGDTTYFFHKIGWWENLQESPIFDGKTMVSCRFSLKPIQWLLVYHHFPY